MTPLESFLALATAYEKARNTDDWAALAQVLAEDMVLAYPVDVYAGGTYEGSESFLFFLMARECFLTRPFDQCDLGALEFPVVQGDTVGARVFAACRSAGLPDLLADFELRISFDEDLAVRVEENWGADVNRRLREYVAQYGEKVQIRADLFDLIVGEELRLLTRAMQRVERRVRSQNRLASVQSPKGLGDPARVECCTTWQAAGLPDLTLDYGLTYTFREGGAVDAELHWQPDMKKRLQAYLQTHGATLRKLASR